MLTTPNFRRQLREFVVNEDGQGITEYGAILAFVAILVAVVFAVTRGALTSAISKAFSAVVSQLNNLSTAAAAAS
jgi:Flp pilus assembly pilin Flp